MINKVIFSLNLNNG